MEIEMKFTESHEWIKVENEIGIVGISDHAQYELGEIVYVELPKVGRTIKAGEEAVVLESTKAAADVYSPVSGEICEVNQALKDKPELVNLYPETEGWLYKIRLAYPKELEELLDPEGYRVMLKGKY